jgi:hypothetical protein
MSSHQPNIEDSPEYSGQDFFPVNLKKRTAFHILNVCGWTGLLLANAYIARFLELSGAKSVLWAVSFFGSGALICLGVRHVYLKKDYRNRPLGSLALIVITTSLIAAAAWYVAELGLYLMVYPREYSSESLRAALGSARLASRLLSNFWPFMMWSILYLAINLWLDWKRERARAAEATLLAQKAQLQMLRYQLNPHFLFNALNSVRSLVDENTEAARGMITELAEFLRYSLVSREATDVPLSSEMEAIGHYLSIQKRRYEDKLEITAEISEEAGRYAVPCFLIHPLVENAVKYGMQTSPMPLKLSIRAGVDGGNLTLTVSNTGRWVVPGTIAPGERAGTGTGLHNVRRRLAVSLPGRHGFAVAETDGMVAVELKILAAGPEEDNAR